jgi:hypothetical protein
MNGDSLKWCLLTLLVSMGLRAGAVVNPSYQIVNDLNSYIQVIPLSKDNVSNLPTAITTVASQLPLGTFLLVNKKTKPIMAATVEWKYVDDGGKVVSRSYVCDGYLRLPSAPVVDSGASALFTPQGCTREELFPRLVSGGLIGPPFERDKAFAAKASSITNVSITVDAVIYGDGEVAGPDKRQYENEIAMRDRAMRSVASSVGSAGKDLTAAKGVLASISSNAVGSHDKQTQLEARWAATLTHSPNLPGTLAAITNAALLPTFFHSAQEGQ